MKKKDIITRGQLDRCGGDICFCRCFTLSCLIDALQDHIDRLEDVVNWYEEDMDTYNNPDIPEYLKELYVDLEKAYDEDMKMKEDIKPKKWEKK